MYSADRTTRGSVVRQTAFFEQAIVTAKSEPARFDKARRASQGKDVIRRAGVGGSASKIDPRPPPHGQVVPTVAIAPRREVHRHLPCRARMRRSVIPASGF